MIRRTSTPRSGGASELGGRGPEGTKVENWPGQGWATDVSLLLLVGALLAAAIGAAVAAVVGIAAWAVRGTAWDVDFSALVAEHRRLHEEIERFSNGDGEDPVEVGFEMKKARPSR